MVGTRHGAPMYHPPGNVISATIGLIYINLQPEYDLPSSNRFGQFPKFEKNWSWGHRPPQPFLRKNFLHVVRVIVRGYLRVRFDLTFLALLTLTLEI